MEQLAREIARLAWQLERDAEELLAMANESGIPAESVDSTAKALERIERKMAVIHGQTSQLMQRIPGDLGRTLADLKRALVMRLEEAAKANDSSLSGDGVEADPLDQTVHPAQSPAAAVGCLSPQERKVFQMCFQSGLLSYRDIATQLEITPTAAKNLVNRIFLSDRKRQLFAKQYKHGMARVGLRPEVQNRILAGRKLAGCAQKRTKDPVGW